MKKAAGQSGGSAGYAVSRPPPVKFLIFKFSLVDNFFVFSKTGLFSGL